MRSVVVGVAFVSVLLAGSVHGSAVASSGKGPFRFLLRVSGVLSHRTVDVRTKGVMSFKAGYIVNTQGGALFDAGYNWGAATNPVVGQYALFAAGDDVGIANLRRRELYHRLDLPKAWPMFTAVGANPETAATAYMSEGDWLLQVLGPVSGHSSVVQKASERMVASERTDALGSWGYGMRAELGFLYYFTQCVGAGVSAGWKLEGARKKDRDTLENMSLVVADQKESVKLQSGAEAQVDFAKISFAHNKGIIADNIKLTRKIEETLSVMANMIWHPTHSFSLLFSVGVRRYQLEASYEIGRLAIPGTPESYTRDFTHDGDKGSRLISVDKNRKLVLDGVVWPVAVGLSLQYHVSSAHYFFAGIEYTSFTHELKGKSETSSKDSDVPQPDYDYVVQKVENPTVETPTLIQIVDAPTAAHQSAAKDVELRISSRFDVREVGATLGYTLML